LRFHFSAGEALPEPLMRRFIERFGGQIYDGIGSAEMFHIYASNRPGDVMPGTYIGIWKTLSANHIPILAMRDTPWLVRNGKPYQPADCLASGGDTNSCGIKRSEVLSDHNPTLDFVPQFPMLRPLDMSDAVCRPDICRVVEGNVLLYHDSHHLSTTYMRTMTSELGRQMGAATGWWTN